MVKHIWTPEIAKTFVESHSGSGLVTKWGKFKAGQRVSSLAESDERNHGRVGVIAAVGPSPFPPGRFRSDDYDFIVQWSDGSLEPGIWNMLKKI